MVCFTPLHAVTSYVIEIVIYPEVVWLAARSLREHGMGHRAAS